MSNTASYDVVTVCTPDEAKTLLTTMIMNYCKHNNVQIEPEKNLSDLWNQIKKTECGLFCMEMIDPEEDSEEYYRFDINGMTMYYLKNGLLLFRFQFDSEYSLDVQPFVSLYNQIGRIPFFELEDSDAGDYYYQEITDKDFKSFPGEWSEDAIRYFKDYYESYSSDEIWKKLEQDWYYSDERDFAALIRGAVCKPAPSVKEIILDPKEMERIQASDPEEFLRQRRLIADLALWDGWDPDVLQPYIEYLHYLDRLEEEEGSGDGSFSTIVESEQSL